MELGSLTHGEPVIVNVYDMMAINDLTKLVGIGVFHTGVELFGTEYAYGGHLSTFTGIYDMNPKDALVLGDDFRYKCSYVIGHTPLTKEEVQLVVAHLGRDYRGNSYSIVRKNCNHFTRDFCLMLCGRSIPRWINRLAGIVRCIPVLGDYAERNMGIPNVMAQCVGSGVINDNEPEQVTSEVRSDLDAGTCNTETVFKTWSSATNRSGISMAEASSTKVLSPSSSSSKFLCQRRKKHQRGDEPELIRPELAS